MLHVGNPVRCRLIVVKRTRWRKEHGVKTRYLVDEKTGERPVVGDMWYDVELPLDSDQLSDYYQQHNRHLRPPLRVVLPGGMHFLVDSKFVTARRGAWGGWMVHGNPPRITMAPSIDIGGTWHGWLQDGVLKDA
jgi:hypothetical protein